MTTLKIIFGLTCVITFLSITGCSSISIRTSIEIDAPSEAVYSVLSDLKSYLAWNPYHRKVEGVFQDGAELTVHVTRPDGKQVEVPPHMIRIVENKEITWGGGIHGIFYGEHSFLLEQIGQDKTRLKHNEDFSGIAVGFIDLPPDVIAKGYQLMNLALKERVESQKYD